MATLKDGEVVADAVVELAPGAAGQEPAPKPAPKPEPKPAPEPEPKPEPSPFAGLRAGRIVHYVLGPGYVYQGQCRPAMVVKIWSDRPEDSGGVAQLVVFYDGGNDRPYDGEVVEWRTSVQYSVGNEPGTWHWIERT
jgi:hypothetical protein